jgi:hypothetical protein
MLIPDFQRPVFAALLVAAAMSGPWGCSSEEKTATDSREERPLKPLVYTEDPDHSPEAAATRERRLRRQLQIGARGDAGRWGAMTGEQDNTLPTLNSAQALGEALFDALIADDDSLWDHVFVGPADYASLVNLGLEDARKFVDTQQGKAAEMRRRLRVDNPSEAPAEGLDSIFEFRGLALGKGRTVDGPVADEDERVVQHWDNTLKVGLVGQDATFEIRIPKIIRIGDSPGSGADAGQAGDAAQNPDLRLGVASTMHLGHRLDVFLKAGLHLKTTLLDSSDYPFPLEVGNYWRYERRPASAADDGGADAPDSPAQSALPATTVTTSVESVDRYGSRRLVHLRSEYNDANLSQANHHWLMTPRRIWECPSPCRRNIDDLDWLLSYLGRQTPVYRFPLELGTSWPERSPTFTVGTNWNRIETPAGSFFGSISIEGVGPLHDEVPFGRIHRMTRYFARGIGIVKREFQLRGTRVVETLVDYRIMPR